MAELTARNAGTETVVAETDRVVLEAVREIIITFCHRTHKYTYALLGAQVAYVILDSNHFGFKAESDFATVGWEMICYRILDHLEQLFLRIGRSDTQAM